MKIDGTDIATVSRRSLREHLGYVSQDPFLFYSTVRENIAYGTEQPAEVSDADIERVARLAGAHEFVTDLEDGRVTEQGTHEKLLARDGDYADLWRVQVGEVGAGD